MTPNLLFQAFRAVDTPFVETVLSLAPKAGQDKAGQSDFLHFAILTAPGENAENTDCLSPPQKFAILDKGGGSKGGSGQKCSIQVPNLNTSSQVCQQHLSQACFSVAPASAF